MMPHTLQPTILLLLLSCNGDTPTDIKNDTIDTSMDVIDADGDGYFSDEDCDDSDASNYPGATEVCDGIDNNCDGEIDENILVIFYLDNDDDGFGNSNESLEACQAPEGYVPNGNDCDDEDPVSYPSASERCDDVDNDCDGLIDEEVLLEWYLDEDGDGIGSDYMIEACNPPTDYVSITGDCDDEEPDAYPENEEICDEIDNNCDGEIDEDLTFLAYVDADEDGFGDDFSVVAVCELEIGMTLTPGDCDDINNAINPNADEVCDDGLDNNCDGSIDETTAIDASMWFLDMDGDGSGDPANVTYSCDQPTGYVAIDDDCNDADGSIYPNAPEICDGIINACGGTLPTYEIDDDGDGYVECTIDVSGWDGVTISGGDDCDDGDALIFPSQQWYADLDGDGFGNPSVSITACTPPANMVLDNTDCNDANANEFPGQVWYLDMDNDGFGNPTTNSTSCQPPTFGVLDNTDCNDVDSTIFPNAPELCDGQINDCNINALPTNEFDDDGDGYVECSIDVGGWDASPPRQGHDCDDNDVSTYPNATENIGDEVDSDCDGGEICILDADDDGHGNPDGLTQISNDADCSDAFEAIASNTDDCDDTNANLNPTLGCILSTCEEILISGQGSTNGIYTVDPDGQGGNAPFDVYCDMTTDGGGWMRVTHLHSNRSIGSIKRDTPFFSAAWQQNSSSFTNRTNSTLVLDNSTYGMLDVDDLWAHTSDVRFTCNDNTRSLSARALWSPSNSQLNSWLAEGNDVNEYQSSPTTVSLSKNGSSFNNANVYLAHNEAAFFGSWHVCGRLSATTGGFQLGFCNNGPGNGDTGLNNGNQIMLGYHSGFSGLRLECTRDTPRPTSIINGNLSIWVR